MTDASSTRLLFRKKRVKLYRGRGEVYGWLRAHHAEVAVMLADVELSWAMLAAEMVRAGVKGKRGESPTPKAAARVWRRVCRDVERAARDAGSPRRKYPSRISPDWRPQVVTPPPVSATSSDALSAGSGAVVGAGAGKVGEEPQSEHAREQYARLDEQIAKLDRKFRF